jgi:hypothetical protein
MDFQPLETKKFVTVANGEQMEILRDGSITILSRKIPNVLLVKNCASNLLSISKLTHELNCDLIFSIKNIIFQE